MRIVLTLAAVIVGLVVATVLIEAAAQARQARRLTSPIRCQCGQRRLTHGPVAIGDTYGNGVHHAAGLCQPLRERLP